MTVFVSYIGIKPNTSATVYGSVFWDTDKLTYKKIKLFSEDLKNMLPEGFNPIILNMIKLDED